MPEKDTFTKQITLQKNYLNAILHAIKKIPKKKIIKTFSLL